MDSPKINIVFFMVPKPILYIIRPQPCPSSFLLRSRNRRSHHPLHLFRPDERLQKHAKLHRTKTEEFEHLPQILLGKSFPIHWDINGIEVREAPLQGRCDAPDIALLKRELSDFFDVRSCVS